MARNQKTNKGNIPADDAFIEWMQEYHGLEVLDPKDEDNALPFAAKLRFAGTKDQPGSPWMIPPPGKRCRGTAYVRDPDGDYILDKDDQRIQRPCYNWPMRGTTVCLSHGGGVTRVKKAAIERLASALDAATGALIKIALNENESAKDRIKAIENIMDRVGVRGGTEIDIKDPGYLDVVKGLFEGKRGAGDDDE